MSELAQYPLSVLKAAVTYNKRRARQTHPRGSFDKAGRWYPEGKDSKVFDYRGHRSPSRAWPYSYMTACRTAEHCAKLYNADVKLVRRAARAIKALAS